MATRKNKNPLLVDLGKKIAHLRITKLSVSQEVLASRIPLHRTYLSGIESGSRNPSYTILVSIAKSLDISVSEMLK
jgi:DNA-binding XRE family transcriptional regulator